MLGSSFRCQRVCVCVAFAAVITVAMAGLATAQSVTGSIQGTIVDQSGAVLPGVDGNGYQHRNRGFAADGDRCEPAPSAPSCCPSGSTTCQRSCRGSPRESGPASRSPSAAR